jgi:hypothetical protein
VDDLSRFCCPNSLCPDHGVRAGRNFSVCGHHGKGDSIRSLRCRSSGDRSSGRKGTPPSRSPPTREKAAAVLVHVAEGCGVRQSERPTGVRRATVTRYIRKAGGHAVAAHDELVALSPRTTEVRFDEKWSFVARKEAHRGRSDPAERTRRTTGTMSRSTPGTA